MTATATGLTRDDIKALRRAETVSFCLSPKDGCRIFARVGDRRAGEGGEVEREIAVESRLIAYGVHRIERLPPLAEVAVCHYYLSSAPTDEHWGTILSSLRQGDVITLLWLRDSNSNGYLEKADLHADRLDLIVDRKNRRMRFIIAIQVCEDNTARMIRRGAFNNE